MHLKKALLLFGALVFASFATSSADASMGQIWRRRSGLSSVPVLPAVLCPSVLRFILIATGSMHQPRIYAARPPVYYSYPPDSSRCYYAYPPTSALPARHATASSSSIARPVATAGARHTATTAATGSDHATTYAYAVAGSAYARNDSSSARPISSPQPSWRYVAAGNEPQLPHIAARTASRDPGCGFD